MGLFNPVPGAKLTDSWGNPRSGGRTHEGIDIFAPKGTPVIATIGGKVTKVGYEGLGGNRVGVTDGLGRYHYYAHLSSYSDNAVVNKVVKAGDVLGYVGDTGNAKGTSPHLHYGVYVGGNAINPYPLLSGQSGKSSIGGMDIVDPYPDGKTGSVLDMLGSGGSSLMLSVMNIVWIIVLVGIMVAAMFLVFKKE